jgi:hypothetical protein
METNEFRDALGAQWPFLTDPGRKIQKDLDIQEYTDPHNDPMIPYTFVLEPGLRIFKIYNGYWYWGRPSNDDLRRDLREVIEKIRPDWDISDPELKAAWERGERERSSRIVTIKERRLRHSRGEARQEQERSA